MNESFQQRRRKAVGRYSVRGDVNVLAWLSRYHYLQPSHIEQLSGRHIVSIRRRLRQLYQSGVVDRLTLPLERDWPVASPPDEFVYRLSRKGLARAQELGFADEHSHFDSEKRSTFLVHDLWLTQFHLCLELAAARDGFQVVGWEQRRNMLQDSVAELNPDAFFGLKNLSAPASLNSRYFFLEMERSRQNKYEAGESSLVRKCRRFQNYAEQKRHTSVWGIQDFRLLVIMPTSERVKNVCQKLEEAQLGFKRFWFADIGSYSLDEPTKILGKIFRTPRDYRTGAIYSLTD